jgi:hypothetical protein
VNNNIENIPIEYVQTPLYIDIKELLIPILKTYDYVDAYRSEASSYMDSLSKELEQCELAIDKFIKLYNN